jgi:hypothetical protein
METCGPAWSVISLIFRLISVERCDRFTALHRSGGRISGIQDPGRIYRHRKYMVNPFLLVTRIGLLTMTVRAIFNDEVSVPSLVTGIADYS